MKAFTICIVVVLSALAVEAQIKPARDCTCVGYEAKAASCPKWPAELKKCDPASEAYKNYQVRCNYLNKYRQGKEDGKYPNVGTRTMSCESYKSFAQSIKEKCGAKPRPVATKRSLPLGSVPTTQTIAPSVDWTSKMTPIKNQGSCGSCWAFAVMGLCEWYLKSKSATAAATILSEQNLVDCDFGDKGCNGGWPTTAMRYIAANGTANSAYAYKAVRGPACLAPKTYIPSFKCPAPIQEYYAAGNDNRLRQILNVTPVVGAMNVMNGFFQASTGIYVPTGVCSNAVNHAIVIVGYGGVAPNNYWIIRNSWGTGWGNLGYAKISASVANQCGISTWLMYY